MQNMLNGYNVNMWTFLQLKTQINELEKVQQNNENKTKLEKLKERLSKEKKNRIFNLETEKFSPEVNVKHYHTSKGKPKLCYKMKQITANSNDATTGHKLQGMSKDVIIVSSWPTGGLSLLFKNLEYVVLSRVRTFSGIYLVFYFQYAFCMGEILSLFSRNITFYS